MTKILKLPKKVKIAGFDYDIISAKYKTDMDSRASYGEIVYDKQNIKIAEGYPEDFTKQTLLHELLHGISRHYNVPGIIQDMEEDLIDAFAEGLHQVLKDNPAIVKLFLKGGGNDGL